MEACSLSSQPCLVWLGWCWTLQQALCSLAWASSHGDHVSLALSRPVQRRHRPRGPRDYQSERAISWLTRGNSEITERDRKSDGLKVDVSVGRMFPLLSTLSRVRHYEAVHVTEAVT